MREHSLNEKCEVLFSPVQGFLKASDLANWVLEEKLPVRFQIQLHKYLWGDVPGK
jgi:7-carboxy-7-deazaguanine synthase